MVKLKKNNWLLVLAVVFGLLIFLHAIKVLQPLEEVLAAGAKPLSRYLYGWGTSFNRSYSDKQTVDDLSVRIETLTKEVARLTVENAKWQETEDENKKLRGQLKFSSEHHWRTVLANVISQEAGLESDAIDSGLVIDKGAKDGLQPGQGVISEEGVIVGKIVAVKEATSKICLTTRPECKLAAALENETKTQGITDGDLGLTIKMDYIPQSEKVAINDIVITSGLGDRIPRGLVIGRVAKIYSASNEVWQEATIETLVNLNSLTVVGVVIP